MRTLRITLQYDGTAYVGWQRQTNGTSIQGLIEESLERIEGRPVTVVGAGRTDAGVHALGQVASVAMQHSIDGAALGRALNATLPHDVRVLAVDEAPDEFHARFDAREKSYRYRVFNGAVVPPFDRAYVWQVARPLDLDRMRVAAAQLVGRHDFAAFQATGSDVATTVREIRALEVVEEPAAWWATDDPAIAVRVIAFDVTGDGFLRHMVRNIVGTLVEIGDGRRDPDGIAALLARRDRAAAGPTAPPGGLFLLRVAY
jgi:tRNA pseudouridine38-40 synthase